MTDFANYIPAAEDIIPEQTINALNSSSLGRQIQLTAAAFDAGIASAVDLYTPGYDTHTNHDSLHEPLFSHLNDSVDLLWTQAEEKGFADRLTVVIASDFSRTPWYNSDGGKDHWPIGSIIVMEKNASWTNKAVGQTDELQNAYNINTSTLERDDDGGVAILPKHVHKALRRHLGMENTSTDENFKFSLAEDFAFFE